MIESLLLLIAADDAASLVAKAQLLTAAEHRCETTANSTDITVCGLRHADRYRVPFIVHDAGDPRYEAVSAERDRLLHRTNPVQDLSPFLVGGGHAGVTVGTRGFNGATGRKLAP